MMYIYNTMFLSYGQLAANATSTQGYKNCRDKSDSKIMVGDESPGWNPLLTSLINLSVKLEKLGIIYADGGVIFLKLYL